MGIFYLSERVGKHGKPFFAWKIRTLTPDAHKQTSFANENVYTKYGKFLRRTKIDELMQLWNVLKGDMALVGPRPEERKTIDVIPEETRRILLSVKPGLTSLASIHFFDEGQILEQSTNQHEDYWGKIKPIKIILDVFYIQNRSLFLDLAILWVTFKKVIKAFFSKR